MVGKILPTQLHFFLIYDCNKQTPGTNTNVLEFYHNFFHAAKLNNDNTIVFLVIDKTKMKHIFIVIFYTFFFANAYKHIAGRDAPIHLRVPDDNLI